MLKPGSVLLAIVILFLAVPAQAASRRPRVNRDSPEGKFLELVRLESDELKQAQLFEQFPLLFPKSEPVAWVYNELQNRYSRLGELRKAISYGEKLLVIEPANVDVARFNWQMAETLRDESLVNRWEAETTKAAVKCLSLSPPSDPEDRKTFEAQWKYSRELIQRKEYAEFSAAMGVKEPAQRIAALDAFTKDHPANRYGAHIEFARYNAYRQLNDIPHALSLAEQMVAQDESRDDIMLFIAEVNYRAQRDSARTLTLASKALTRLASGKAPAGYDPVQWESIRPGNFVAASHIVGSLQLQSGKWAAADRVFRAMLPMTSDPQLRAEVLYDLGLANYHLNAATDSIRFYSECAAIPSPLRDQALKAIRSVKQEFSLP